MRIRVSKKLQQAASALLVTLVLGGLLCVFVMYYLALIEQQNKLSVRSQAWNIAIAVTEAGIEEGLQALNSPTPPSTADGWQVNGTLYWCHRTLPDGNSYYVTNNLANPNLPVVTARAYIQLPALAASTPSAFFATAGVNNTPVGPCIVTRAVRVTCAKNPTSLFTAAMVSKHAIDLKGNGVSTDSFDSSNPAKSTNGKYDPNKYRGDFGDAATNDGIIVGVGNANIYGKLHTGPGGNYDLGPNGSVGTHAWQAANGGSGMQPGYFLEDANFTFPDTSLPDATTYLTPQPGDIISTTFPVTTNSITTTNYPYPAPWGGITTNIASYVTNTVCPSPAPPGLTTITTWVYNSPTQPNPIPAGLVTNTIVQNSSTRPSPAPPGLVTNTVPDSSKSYPAAGTYVPPVVLIGKWYFYNRITGYTWNTYTYNYPTYKYSWPVITYTYFESTTNMVTTTNHFDNVLNANTRYKSSALNGRSIVMGPNVTLVLSNGLSGAEQLFFNYTDNSNPGLTIYAGSSSASISGNQYINPSGFAGSLLIYCAPSVTDFTLNGNGQFTGVLVAPNADLKMNGGGNSEQDFCGSLMVNNVRLNGHFHFHWDEALGRMASDNDARYLVKSWNEIP